MGDPGPVSLACSNHEVSFLSRLSCLKRHHFHYVPTVYFETRDHRIRFVRAVKVTETVEVTFHL